MALDRLIGIVFCCLTLMLLFRVISLSEPPFRSGDKPTDLSKRDRLLNYEVRTQSTLYKPVSNQSKTCI